MTGRNEPSPASGAAVKMDAETEQICWYVMTGYALDKRRGVSIAAQVEKYNAEHDSGLEVFAAGVPIFLYPRAAVSGEGFPVAQQRV